MRFKRLIFVVNSASEQLQHILHTYFAGIPSSLDIAEDIFIYGKNKKEHDETLETDFSGIAFVGFTLNFRKCIFDKNNLEYFGYIFSKHGMKPSLKEVSALKNAQRPTNKRSV